MVRLDVIRMKKLSGLIFNEGIKTICKNRMIRIKINDDLELCTMLGLSIMRCGHSIC